MTDLTRPIAYRGTALNDLTAQVGKPGAVGTSVDFMDISLLDVEQYADKKAWADGIDYQGVGNLGIGLRHVEMRGAVYGQTRGDTWDRLVALRSLFDPLDAYNALPDLGGFAILSWSEAGQYRYVNAAAEGLRYTANRDRQGGRASGENGLAIPWACAFTTRDPRVYGLSHAVDVVSSPVGNLVNDGDFPAPVTIDLDLDGFAGSIAIAIGGTAMRFTVETGAPGRTVRYDGLSRLLTLQNPGSSDLIYRRDILSFNTPNSDTQHPALPPGSSPYSFSPSGVGIVQGFVYYSDAYA